MKQIEDEVHKKYGDNDATMANRVMKFSLKKFFLTKKNISVLLNETALNHSHLMITVKYSIHPFQLLQALTDFAVAEFYHTLAEILQDLKPEIPIYLYKFQYESNLNGFSNLIRSKCVEKLKGSKIYTFFRQNCLFGIFCINVIITSI